MDRNEAERICDAEMLAARNGAELQVAIKRWLDNLKTIEEAELKERNVQDANA